MAIYDAQVMQRRATAENWTNDNPILLLGEQGYETDAGIAPRMKVGDGITAWNDLPYTYAMLRENTFIGVQNWAHGDNIASASTIDLNTVTGNFIDITGTTTIQVITLGDGFTRIVRFAGILTLKNSANLILLGDADIITAPGDIALFVGDAGDVVQMVGYSRADGTALVGTDANSLLWTHGANITSASTINLTTATGDYVYVTGGVNISSITLDNGLERTVRFVNPLTLVHNVSAISLPGQANIDVRAGDIAVFRGDNGGVVRVISYTRYDGTALIETNSADLLWVHGDNIASASTVNLNNATGDYVYVTGTTTINAITLDNGLERTVRFTESLTLTHNTLAINLPGNANITTEAGDIAVFRGDNGGRVRVVSYTRRNGKAVVETNVLPFIDSSPLIRGSSDETKLVRFEVDGLTTDTTRVLTVQDQSGTIALLSDIEEIVTDGILPAPDSTFIAKGSVDNTKKMRFEIDALVSTETDVVLTIQDRDITVAGLDDVAAAISGITLPVIDTTALVKGSVNATKQVRLEADGLTASTTRVLTVQDKNLIIAGLDDIDAAVAYVALPVLDTTAIVKGSGDPTKQVRLEVDALLTAGVTRVMTIQDKDIIVAGLDDIADAIGGLTANVVINPGVTPYTVTAHGNVFVVVPTGVTTTVKLLAAPNDGDKVVVIAPSDADTHNVTVNPNGHDINGSASNITITAPYSTEIFVYNAAATEWRRYIVSVSGAEMVVNKSTDVITDAASNIKYPSVKSVFDWVSATKQSLFIIASEMADGTTTATYTPTTGTYDFSPAIAQDVKFGFALPKAWNAGTVSFRFYTMQASTTAGGVAFGLKIGAAASGDSATPSYGSQIIQTMTVGTTGIRYKSGESAAITVGNSPTKECWLDFNLQRVVTDGADTMNANAQLTGIMIYYTTDAISDA